MWLGALRPVGVTWPGVRWPGGMCVDGYTMPVPYTAYSPWCAIGEPPPCACIGDRCAWAGDTAPWPLYHTRWDMFGPPDKAPGGRYGTGMVTLGDARPRAWNTWDSDPPEPTCAWPSAPGPVTTVVVATLDTAPEWATPAKPMLDVPATPA